MKNSVEMQQLPSNESVLTQQYNAEQSSNESDTDKENEGDRTTYV